MQSATDHWVIEYIRRSIHGHVAPGSGDEPRCASTSHKLALLFAVYAVGHLVAAIYYFWHAVYLRMPYPYNSYLSLPVARFTDYDNMIVMCRNLDPYHEFTRSGYPPFANFLFYLFSTLSIRYGFFIYILAPIVFVRWVTCYVLDNVSLMERSMAVIFLMLFSYPFLFTLDRGNVEFYILIATGTFFVFYNSPHSSYRDLAAFGLAAGIAIKVYPILLLVVPFKDRRYTDCVKVVALALLMTVFAAGTFNGGAFVALSDFRGMLNTTGQLVKDQIIYAHGNAGLYYGIVIILKKLGMNAALAVFYRVYWLIGLSLLLVYCLVIARSRLSYWASCTCLVALMCLIPSLSNDYRTLQILVPMLLFARSETPDTRSYAAIAIILGVLLVPRNYWLMFPEIDPGDIGIGSVLTPVLLLLLLNLVLFEEWRRWATLAERSSTLSVY